MHCGVTFKCIIYQQHQLFFFLFMFYNNFHKFVSFKSYFVWKHFTDSESAFSEFLTWKWKSLNHVRLFCDPMDYTVHGQNTGVSSCSLLQGIFPTQGLNPGLRHCRLILYCLSHQGSPEEANCHVIERVMCQRETPLGSEGPMYPITARHWILPATSEPGRGI